MSELVTIKVSDQVVHWASQIASQKQQPMEEVLSEWLESAVHERPIETLSDEEVLTLSEMVLSDEEDTEMSDLLARQRERNLDDEGRRRLNELMRGYEKGLLRKAQALRVAVERGLLDPLQF